MSVLAAVRQANLPGPPEDSVAFRAASAAAVVVAIVACWAQSELSPAIAVVSVVLVVAGNAFSYWRRNRAFPFLKVVLAVAVVVAFVWFFATISRVAAAGDLASVEGPLAVLFTVIQVTHAFDVPSRRDLGFSLAGSATLMAVAAAQAVDTTFAVFVVVWAACGLVGLLSMWGSMAGGARLGLRTILGAAGAVLVLGLAVVAVLPATHANSSLVLPSAIAGDLPVNQAAALVGGGARGTEPVHPGSPTGRVGVGGYLGFAGPLDTAVRGSLGTQVVLRVRADRPSFWLAETFDTWNGQSWSSAPAAKAAVPWRQLNSGSPFLIPSSVGEVSQGSPDYQTFYIAQPGPNLVFHAANAASVWFPAHRLYVGPDGTIRSGTSMGAGSIYTVLSITNTATPAQLESAGTASPFPGGQLPAVVRAQSIQLPHPYPRAAALASRVTAHATTTYAKVVALEDWLGSHTKYTTDIPPLGPGQDTVDQFLFKTRRGYCEQISTSLAVMLRSLGIPAREATGYVPGPYNPITDLYEVQAKDAHAWVQVWFPGYGWQSFDPTAYVGLANPTPGDVLAHDLASLAGQVPWIPLTVVAAALLAVVVAVRRRRHRPATWAAAVTRELERAGRRARLGSGPGEPLPVLAARLDRRIARAGPAGPGPSWPPGGASELAARAELAAYGGREPDHDDRRDLLARARRLRRRARRLRAGAPGDPVGPGGGAGPGGGISPPTAAPGPLPSSPRLPAGAGRP